MAYLDWSEASIAIDIEQPSPSKTRLNLKLGQKEIRDFLAYLEQVYLSHEGEFRLQISPQWTVFWKERESGSRALLAHPEEMLWVGTIALERADAESFLLSLKNLEERQSLVLGQSVPLASVSNLDIAIFASK